MLTPPSDGNEVPPKFVLRQQGDVIIRDDSPQGDPVVINLDATAVGLDPIIVQTGAFVSWRVESGTWYVTGEVSPPANRQGR